MARCDARRSVLRRCVPFPNGTLAVNSTHENAFSSRDIEGLVKKVEIAIEQLAIPFLDFAVNIVEEEDEGLKVSNYFLPQREAWIVGEKNRRTSARRSCNFGVRRFLRATHL